MPDHHPLLNIRNLTVSYGGIQAVKGLTFHVEEGELVCLIGCNGAGKTTTLNAIAGLLPFKAEMAQLSELDLGQMASHERLANGLSLVPEGRGIFKKMSIEENLRTGCLHVSNLTLVKDRLEEVYSIFPRLKERHSQKAGTLSGGEQQMLAMGRAMMGCPKVLLLDEPSMGLAPIMVEKIFEVIQRISSQGTTILLVEQNAHIALEVADRGYVMDSGLIDLSGPASELLTDQRVREAYLGQA